MRPVLLPRSLFVLALSVAATAAAAEEIVHFNSLDGTTNLTAYLSRPQGNLEGNALRPAGVMMHGCSGLLDAKGRMLGLYRAWMRALVVQGYAVLAVDSATSRGFGETCSAGANRIVMWRDRPKDAYAALQYLQAQVFVQADRVGLMGWSQGGGVVLLSVNDKSVGRPAGLAHEFKAAVSFYPAPAARLFNRDPTPRSTGEAGRQKCRC